MPKLPDVAEVKAEAKRRAKEGNGKANGRKPAISPSAAEKPSPQETTKVEPANVLAEQSAVRDVIYPTRKAVIFEGDKAINYEKAKKILGWKEAPEGAKEGVFVIAGQRVLLTNNVSNRPLYASLWETYKFSHLQRRWKLNGENLIIGRTGIVLEGQHTLVGFIEAVHEWRKDEKWREYWPEEPIMERFAALGVDEDDSTVNTINTGKPRSLADVIFRSEYFKDLSTKDRKNVSKRTSYAIAMLWERTGAKLDAFAPIRTHEDSCSFIARHPRVLEAVKHIYGEDGTDSKIGRYLSPGYSAAMMYLMGTSATEREKEDKTGYSDVNEPSESQLDFSNWDVARDFWTNLAGGAKEMAPIREALGVAIEGGYGTVATKCALIAKAWLSYAQNDCVVLEEDLVLDVVKDPDTGVPTITECPTVGGIDLGKPS